MFTLCWLLTNEYFFQIAEIQQKHQKPKDTHLFQVKTSVLLVPIPANRVTVCHFALLTIIDEEILGLLQENHLKTQISLAAEMTVLQVTQPNQRTHGE